jgi:hypothetical protein
MTGAMRLEILSSLASVREDVERQVAKLDRYRALKAIEQTISDFPGLEDLNNSLSEIRERMRRQIEGTREVRALRAVEKIMPELSEVLTFLSDCSDAGQEASQPADRDDASAGSVADAGSQPATEEVVVATSVQVDAAGDIAPPAPVNKALRPQSEPERLIADGADPGSAPAPANDAGTDLANPPQTTISYGIAQFLNPPPDDEAVEGSTGADPRGEDEDLAQFRAPASQEGRAA